MIIQSNSIWQFFILGLMLAWLPALIWTMFSFKHKLTDENSTLHLLKAFVVAYFVAFLPVGISIVILSFTRTNDAGYQRIIWCIVGTFLFWCICWIWSSKKLNDSIIE